MSKFYAIIKLPDVLLGPYYSREEADKVNQNEGLVLTFDDEFATVISEIERGDINDEN